jgi:hypothetical protein
MPTKNIRVQFLSVGAGAVKGDIDDITAKVVVLEGEHPIDFTVGDDTVQVDLDDLLAKVMELSDKIHEIAFDTTDDDALAEIDDLYAHVEELTAKLHEIRMGLADGDASEELASIQSQVQSLTDDIHAIKVLIADPGVNVALDELLLKLQAIAKDVVIPVEMVDTGAKADLDDLMLRAMALRAALEDVKVNFTEDGFTQLTTAIAALIDDGRKLGESDFVKFSENTEGLVADAAEMAAFSLATDDANASLAKVPAVAAPAKEALAGVAGAGYYGWGILSKPINLWGGAFGQGALSHVQLWHIALDGIIEAGVILVPTFVTLAAVMTAWGSAAGQTLMQVYDQMHDYLTVLNVTTKTQLGPFTGSLLAMQNAVRPGIYELLGDAFNSLGKETGLYNEIVMKTMSYLDQLGARITLFVQNGGKSFQEFLNLGEHDLGDFGQIFDNLGHAFGNLLKAMPGFASGFLTMFTGLSKVIALISDLPTPVLYAAIGLHGLWLWGGLATDMFANFTVRLASVVGKLVPVSDGIINLGQALHLSSDNMVKLLSSTSSIQTYASITGRSVDKVAAFAEQNDLATASVYDLSKAEGDAQPGLIAMAADAGVAGEKMTLAEKAGSSLRTAIGGLVGWITSPQGLIVAGTLAAAALGYLTYKLVTAKDATETWIGALNQKLSSTAIMEIIPALGNALTEVDSKLAASRTQLDSMPGSLQGFSDKLAPVAPALDAVSSSTGIWAKATRAMIEISTPFGPMVGRWIVSLTGQTGALGDVSKATQELTSEQEQLYSEQSLAVSRVQDLAKAYGTNYVGALALANVAGIKSSQLMSTNLNTWKMAETEIAGVVSGYKAMGQAGTNMSGPLGADMNVLAYASSTMLQSVQRLNQGWDTFTQNVAAPRTDFIAFAQSLVQFSSDASVTGASLSGLGTGIQKVASKVTNASLQLQSDFQNTYSSANTMLDSLRTAGAPLGTVTSVIKDLVAVMIPMAGHSKAAAAEVYTLAEEANYQGSPSIQALTKWVGDIHDPLLRMQDATNKVVIATSNLSWQAKNLTSTLQTDENAALVNNAMSLFHISHLQEIYLADLKKYGETSPITIRALHNLNKAQVEATKYVTEAGNQQAGLVHHTKKVSQAYDDLRHHLTPYAADQHHANEQTDEAAKASDKAKQHIDGLERAVLDVTGAWNWLWKVLTVKSIDDAISRLGAHEVSNLFDGWSSEISHVFDDDIVEAPHKWFDQVRSSFATAGVEIGHFTEHAGDDFRTFWDDATKGKGWAMIARQADKTNARIKKDFDDMRHHVADIFEHLAIDTAPVIKDADGIRHHISHIFDDLKVNTSGFFSGLASGQDLAGLGKTVESVRHTISTQFDQMRHEMSASWDSSWGGDITEPMMHGIDWIEAHSGSMSDHLVNAFEDIKRNSGSIWSSFWGQNIEDPTSSGIDWVKSHLDGFGGSTGSQFGSIKSTVSSTWDDMWKNGVTNPMLSSTLYLWEHLKGFGGNFTGFFTSLKETLSNIWNGMWGWFESVCTGAVSKIARIVDNIKSAFSTPIDWVVNNVYDKFAGIWNWVATKLSLGSLKLPIAHMSTGGVVPGGKGGGDKVPALLEPGERILSLKQVEAFGGHQAIDEMVGKGTGGHGHYSGGGTAKSSSGSSLNPLGFLSGIGSDLEGIASWGLSKLESMANWTLGKIESVAFGPVESLLKKIPGSAAIAEILGKLIMSAIKAAASNLKSGVASAGGVGDYSAANLLNVGKYMYAHGYHRAAAAGIASCVAGESGGNPEATGSGGNGLIGWTPPLPGIVTGNVVADFNKQLPLILQYNDRFRQYIPILNAQTNPVSAADIYSQDFERPAVTDHDVQVSVAESVYRGLRNGGYITEPVFGVGQHTGTPYKFGETGTEYVSPLNGSSIDAGGSNVNVSVNFNGVVGDPDKVGLQIQQVLRRLKKHRGNQPLGFE